MRHVYCTLCRLTVLLARSTMSYKTSSKDNNSMSIKAVLVKAVLAIFRCSKKLLSSYVSNHHNITPQEEDS